MEEEQESGEASRILKEVTTNAEGVFYKHAKATTLSLELLPAITSDPRGVELFAKTLIEKVRKYDPFKSPTTMVGVRFVTPENEHNAWVMEFTNMNDIKVGEVVENFAKMSPNKSPFELNAPYIDVTITYLNGPLGSKKKKISNFDELPDSKQKFKLDEEHSTKKLTRSNIMPNEVLADSLPHALYQSLMYTQWKQRRTLESKNKYRSSVRKSYKRPRICPEIYEAVSLMKEEAGIRKSSNFDKQDIEKFQKTVFADNYQIVTYVKNSSTPYFLGPYVGDGKQLLIYLDDRHFSGVRSVAALLKTHYYCFLCNTKYRNLAAHYNCPLVHRLFGRKDCDKFIEGEEFQCKKCTVKFNSRPQGGKSRCDYTLACEKCGKVFYTIKQSNKHPCGNKLKKRCYWYKITNQHQ